MVEAGLDLVGHAAGHRGRIAQRRAVPPPPVRAVLAEGGLTEDDLANAPALPYGAQAAEVAWIRAGGGPTA